MSSLIDVQAIIDAAVEKRSQVRGEARDADKFHVSDSGTCYRKRYFKRLGIQPTIPIPTASLRKMLAGDAGHDMLQGLLRYSGDLYASEQTVGDDNIKGHHDGIIKPGFGPAKVLLEFKTIEKWSMSHITGACSCAGPKAHAYGPKPEHELQMFTYWTYLREEYTGLDQAALVYLKREDFGAKQFDYVWNESVAQRVLEEWEPLLTYWRKLETPECTCDRDFNGAGRGYCRYKSEDGLTCCNRDLLLSLVAPE